jgi:branched-chain amino acid transport system permease protein
MYLLMKSDIGLAFLAIKENELVAKSLGINVVKYKLLAFLISTFFAGVAGSLEVHTAMGGYVSPEIYGIDYSFKPLMYCIAGGLGTIEGPIIGTIAMTALWEWLRFLGTYERFMFIGILLVLIVIFLPKGITSAIRKLASRLFREKASTQAPR